jgi:DNA mismatch repair protein MutS
MGGINSDNLTPAMRQYVHFKELYPDCVLLFRMGDFYEMFYKDAEIASKVLGITLTSRGKGEKKAPLAGVPLRAANTYISKFIRAGYKVAIADQIEDPKTVKGRVIKRDVVRIITPGTILNEELLDSSKNNYLCAIYPYKDNFGIAFADITTGEFTCCQTSNLQSLKNELAKISPSECLIPISLMVNQELIQILKSLKIYLTDYEDSNFNYDGCYSLLIDHFKTQSLKGFGIEEHNQIISASGALLNYIKETQKQAIRNITRIKFININDFMMLDSVSLRNLELFENIVDRSSKNTLIKALDETVTAMGSRLLKKWMERPLLNIEKINIRLNAISELKEKRLETEQIRSILNSTYDIERIIGRLAYNSINPKDLIAIRDTLEIIPKVKEKTEIFSSELFSQIKNLPLLSEIKEKIIEAIKDNPSAKLNEGGIIKNGYNSELDELRNLKENSRETLKEIEEREIEKTKIKSLRVGYNQVIGYFIQVSNSYLSLVPEDYKKKQTLTNGERFITEELKLLESKILGAEERITILEYELFKQILQQVEGELFNLQEIAEKLSLLDVLCSLAHTASKYNYAKPEIKQSGKLTILNGRHPVVERIESQFIPNDTILNEKDLVILTGPNMAGKSTFMRQVCLIVIMAQMGSFVPAEIAKVGIIDRIFSRVGAYDDLAHGQSTFMVEMDETSNILNNATENSLIILDEVGRGTSTYDGVAIAWSVVEHIYKNIKAKTLFATHYHVLNKMSDEFENIKNYNIAVKEKEDEIIFLRKIIEGGTDKSYGIHVAKIAGMPKEVIDRALEIQEELTKTDDMIEKLEGKKDEKQFSLRKWEL